jgi:hypothetical protein
MDYRSLVNKLEAISNSSLNEATAPTVFKPTHFHKGNLGNKNPVMQMPDGSWWWESNSQGGEGGMGGTQIVPWQGNTENRSGWNPASIDGVITPDGKYIDFPEGVSWKQYKEKQDADSRAALLAKLKQLIELVDKYLALKAKRKGGQGAKPDLTPKTQDMGDGSKLTTDPKTGKVAATNDDGTPYIPGSNPNLPKNKTAESKLNIAQSLVESFGYELEERSVTGDVPLDPNFGKAPVDSKGNPKPLPGMDRTINPPASTTAPTTAPTSTPTTAPGATTAGAKTAAKTGAKTAMKTGSKLLGRALPGVGAYMGATDAIDSYKKGDYLGAALNGLSGAFSLVPGVGWIPAVGFAAWQAGREMSGATDKYDNPPAQGASPGGNADPKVLAIQKKILAKDPKALPQHGADGIMGPETQAAMARLNIKEGTEMNQPKSLAESIKELQQRLEMIENEERVSEEGEAQPASSEERAIGAEVVKAGGKLFKHPNGNQYILLPDGKTVVDTATHEIVDASTEAMTPTGEKVDPSQLSESMGLDENLWSNIFKGAAKLARSGAVNTRRFARTNPIKTAAGVGAAGLAGGYATGSAGSDNKPPKPPTTGQSSGQSGQGGQTTPPAEDDAEMKALRAQIDALIKDLSTSQDPEIQKGLADINAKLK